ncbi:MAG: EAL domain-containing protein [Dissulfurimicrobium hydrothermale]|uniref:EAL domain-containing protein n=1 Tax=Dissulfurimicrobium hydrothermale TaxID=1750598 RepID=UPI003C73B56D
MYDVCPVPADIFVFKDSQGRWIDANLSALRLFGLEDTSWHGKSDEELINLAGFPSAVEVFMRAGRMEEGAGWHGRGVIALQDGRQKKFAISWAPAFRENSLIDGLILFGRDLAGCPEAEKDDYGNELLGRLLVLMFSSDSLKARTTSFLGGIHSLLPAVTKSSVFLNSENEEKTLLLFAYRNLDLPLIKFCQKVPYNWCLCGRAAAGKRIIKEDVDNDHEIRFDSMASHGHVVLPIKYNDIVLGVLSLHLKPGSLFSAGELGLVDSAANIIGAAIRYDSRYKKSERLGMDKALYLPHAAALEEWLDLLAVAFEDTEDALTVTDPMGKILMINPAVTRITGYLPEEIIGQNPRVLKSDRHGSEFYKEMWEAIKKVGRWQGEIWNRRKSGEVYLEQLTINAIKDRTGNIINYIATFHELSCSLERQAALQGVQDYDPLTTLPNLPLFLDYLKLGIEAAGRKEKLVVALIDLDDFTAINNSFGFVVGDNILKIVAKRLMTAVRLGDTIARHEDAFFLLLRDIKSEDDAMVILNRLMEAVSSPIFLEGREIHLTCSIGVSFYPSDALIPDQLVGTARIALKKAQTHGIGHIEVFTQDLNKRMTSDLILLYGLKKAVSDKEFILYYQPKLDLLTRRIMGCEALIRWIRPDGVFVSPAEFIPIAEKSDLIFAIGEWVIKEAVRQAVEWRDLGHPISVAVNLSPKQFRQKNLVDMVKTIIGAAGLHPSCLEFEITETAILEDEEDAIGILWKLKKLGINISIDDFGTGYSSLFYLKQLPIDALKIDKTFIDGLPDFEDDALITSAIINLAHSLKLMVIAEGVERDAQLEFLNKAGCDGIQGFLCSPPVPAADLLERLKNRA